MILTGCVAFAEQVGAERVETELLPQCWEQVLNRSPDSRHYRSREDRNYIGCSESCMVKRILSLYLLEFITEVYRHQCMYMNNVFIYVQMIYLKLFINHH